MSRALDRRRWTRFRRGVTLPVLLIALWFFATHAGLVDSRLLPPIEAVLRAGRVEWTEGALLQNLEASLFRNLAGFAIGSTLGLAFGMALGISPLIEKLCGPLFHGLRQVALLAWVPLICMWLGLGEASKIAFIAIAAFVPVALNTYQGARAAPPQLLEVSRVLLLSPRQMFRRVYLPAALPSVVTGIHLALIYSWLATIGAEYFMALGPGLGGLILAGRDRFEMDLVILGVFILGLVGFALNLIAQFAAGRLLRWE